MDTTTQPTRERTNLYVERKSPNDRDRCRSKSSQRKTMRLAPSTERGAFTVRLQRRIHRQEKRLVLPGPVHLIGNREGSRGNQRNKPSQAGETTDSTDSLDLLSTDQVRSIHFLAMGGRVPLRISASSRRSR